jgi:hypothetical protein
VTPDDLKAWAETARPGNSVVYFSGTAAAKSPTLNVARQLLRSGKVTLIQRRVRPKHLEYSAVRVSAAAA